MQLSAQQKETYEMLVSLAGDMIMESINDDNITEIMLNPDGMLWVEDRNKGMFPKGEMHSQDALSFIYCASGYAGHSVTRTRPYLEVELPFDRARFEATVPPITSKPAFTIRKRAKKIYTMTDYLDSGIITFNQVEAIKEIILNKKSILVCGAPGTGKTTFVNACIDLMTSICSKNERIYSIEDVQELQCKSTNLYSTFTDRYSGVDHAKLLHIALRTRPDRILVGEVRDGAMLELLKAWNVGCPGIATVHSNTASANAALQRCMDLAMEKTQSKPISLIKESVNMVVTIERTRKNNSGRIINNVAVVEGYDNQNNEFNFRYIN